MLMVDHRAGATRWMKMMAAMVPTTWLPLGLAWHAPSCAACPFLASLYDQSGSVHVSAVSAAAGIGMSGDIGRVAAAASFCGVGSFPFINRPIAPLHCSCDDSMSPPFGSLITVCHLSACGFILPRHGLSRHAVLSAPTQSAFPRLQACTLRACRVEW